MLAAGVLAAAAPRGRERCVGRRVRRIRHARTARTLSRATRAGDPAGRARVGRTGGTRILRRQWRALPDALHTGRRLPAPARRCSCSKTSARSRWRRAARGSARPTRRARRAVRGHPALTLRERFGAAQAVMWREDGRVYEMATGTPRAISLSAGCGPRRAAFEHLLRRLHRSVRIQPTTGCRRPKRWSPIVRSPSTSCGTRPVPSPGWKSRPTRAALRGRAG